MSFCKLSNLIKERLETRVFLFFVSKPAAHGRRAQPQTARLKEAIEPYGRDRQYQTGGSRKITSIIPDESQFFGH